MINPHTSVRYIMTSPVIRATTDTSVVTLAEVMFAKNISAVPVVDERDRPIGIVSKTDLLRVSHENAGTEEHDRTAVPSEPTVEAGMHEVSDGATAGEIMTPMVFSVGLDTPIATAAALMTVERIHRVPVVGAEGDLVGIVSALDVLEWLARGSGYLVPDRTRAVLSTG